MANMNTNIFWLTFVGEYKFEYIGIPFLRQKQIQIYSGLPKNGWIWIGIQLFGLIFTNTNTNRVLSHQV